MTTDQGLIDPDILRARFSDALSDMYRREVPLYGTLLELVAALGGGDDGDGGDGRLRIERHGAIRVGTPAELAGIRRLFAVMGLHPVGHYDLAAAGVPVHSTAFRPIAPAALAACPFRIFTSLLRLELIADPALRDEAAALLSCRRIFAEPLLALLARCEAEGGLPAEDADAFIAEALAVFRWHGEAAVDADTHRRFRLAHPLVADVVCFRNPHINHLTPRTTVIDAVHDAMHARGMNPKPGIEGPPRRRVPILLRQTSFLALGEAIRFTDGVSGTHTARFGEVEQRGAALTPRGRALYDRLLARMDAAIAGGTPRTEAVAVFDAFPDDLDALRSDDLAFFRPGTREPILYEDFLPVSAAGIFRSNLGRTDAGAPLAAASRTAFETALGAPVHDEMALYAREAGA